MYQNEDGISNPNGSGKKVHIQVFDNCVTTGYDTREEDATKAHEDRNVSF